jgi:5-methylthioadenosine/S-adenosylhomocysteine deaminase
MIWSWSTAIVLLAQMTAATPEPVDLLVRGCTVLTMDADRSLLAGGAVAVRSDRIVGIYGPSETLPPAAQTLEATGHLVIPGLVNTHGHVPMSLLRGIADDLKLMEWLEEYIFPAEARYVTPEFVYWGTLLSCVEMALGGTTTFTDMYYFEQEVARATAEAGLRGVLGQTIIGFPAPDYATPAEALDGARAFIEAYAGHPLIVPSVAPHALYTTPLDIVRQAHQIAQEYGIPLQIHAAEAPLENDAVMAAIGMRTIDALMAEKILAPGTILHHGVWLSEQDIVNIAHSGASVSHNPESNMKTAAGVAPVVELLDSGVPVGLGTDGPASNNNLDLFEEMDTAAKLHKLVHEDPTVLPAETVVYMATLGGARVLGLDDRIGSLEPGKLADMVLIDLQAPDLTPLYDVYSHLVYAVKARHVRTVIVSGKIVVRDREMLTVDTEQVLSKAREFREQLLDVLDR